MTNIRATITHARIATPVAAAAAAATLGLCIHGIQVLLPLASGVLVDTLVLLGFGEQWNQKPT
ncbi:hypothetical protein [Pseudomonas sp.]|uniref:hypothetical protein n=1 Tax=Pseudomonas sp. TaxID=306 RepID=UPI0029071552|nr:hypothetical protein [Pseudomonas sp.]MDU4254597.1 hypothetical protein [Pseudomonas sp.]